MRWVQLALAAAVFVLPANGAPEAPTGEGAKPGDAGRGSYTAEEVQAAVEEHIRARVSVAGGIYPMQDDHTGKLLELEFVRVGIVSAGALWKVHDPGHRIERRAFFACASFHPVGAPQEMIYDVDLRVEPRDGHLEVTEVWIHKEKRLVGGKWTWQERPARPGSTPTSSR